MDGIRRGIALAVALFLGAAPAMAGKGIWNISVRRQVNLASVAVQAIVSGDDDSNAVVRLLRSRDEAATGPRANGARSGGRVDACSLTDHREVSRT